MEILLLTDMAVDVHAMLRESLCRALASRALSARRSTDCVAAAKRPSVAVAQFSFSDGIRVFCKPTTQLRDAHLAVLATSTCERSSLVDGFGGEADAAGGQTAHAGERPRPRTHPPAALTRSPRSSACRICFRSRRGRKTGIGRPSGRRPTARVG